MNWLFDTNEYIPRSDCGNWPYWLVFVAVLANILIGLAYIGIPLLLFTFWRRKRKMIPRSFVLVHFGMFIVSCGSTHFVEAITFFWPLYRLLVVTDVMTAFFSIATVWYLPRVLLEYSNFKTPGEYREVADQLEKELTVERDMLRDVASIIHILEDRIERLEVEIVRKGWIDEQSLKLDELRETLSSLKGKYNGTPK